VTSSNRPIDFRVHLTIISLLEGDITESDVDAIVNPANAQLQLGGGVAGAIRDKGGPDIQKECDKLAPIEVGQAVITGAGNLRARHVIHAVGPRMGDGDEDRKLASATRAALAVATEKGLATMAFPAISTGIFGYPKDRCAQVMMQTVVDFLEAGATSLRQIDFCLLGSDTYGHFQNELEKHRAKLETRKA
jgi:O-acetyl-ADP-ribose deacetylase (regulator of RNase III)